MTFDFTGRRVVVCGGSRGIGRSIALGFAKAGAAVSICARGQKGLDAARHELGAKGHAAPCDLADHEEILQYIAEAADALGGIDVLVNNASGLGLGDDEAAWQAGFAVDVMATVRATHAAMPYLERSHDASIVNISSISGLGASTRTPAYNAVKAVLFNYTKSQAAKLAPQRIRANAVAPGSIEFPGGLWEQRKTDDPALYQGTLAGIPFGRMGAPEEIANVVMFLASPLARWITGQTIVVDGGQSLL
jgi:3-oxoacyl-[acyl-carrier protein] reductase